jgi:hypothetical protein
MELMMANILSQLTRLHDVVDSLMVTQEMNLNHTTLPLLTLDRRPISTMTNTIRLRPLRGLQYIDV